MALSKLAATVVEKVPWRTCVVCHALASIPPGEAEGLRTLLRSNLTYRDISALIAADPDTPLVIDRQALSRHARGECAAKERLR